MLQDGKKKFLGKSLYTPPYDRLPLLFRGIRRASTSISSSHPPSWPTLLMHLTSQATVDLYHAALSLLLRPLRLRPPDQRSCFPGRSTCFTSTWTNLDDWLTPRRRTGLGTDDDAMMTVDHCLRPSRLGISLAWPARRDA